MVNDAAGMISWPPATVVGTPWVTLAPIWSVGSMVADRVKTAQVQGPTDVTSPRQVLACNLGLEFRV